MSIDLHTLKCGECGSNAVHRTGPNQYRCAHCGSVSIVEDDVSQRLDRVLEQVKDAAAQRLLAEQRLRQQQALRVAGLAIGGLMVFTFAAVALSTFIGGSRRPAATAVEDRAIAPEGLRFSPPRQVLVGSGSSAQPKLLVVARNETGGPLDSPTIAVTYYNGNDRIGSSTQRLPVGLLGPGESAPVLVDMPGGDRAVTRQEVSAQRLSRPYRTASGPRLAFARVRLVQQGRDLRLVGRVDNNRPGSTLSGIRVLSTAYDEAGLPVAYGWGFSQDETLRPGERGTVDFTLQRFGGNTPIVSWSYRIDYDLKGADDVRSPVAGSDHETRTTGQPETLPTGLRMGAADLLAEDSERFDMAQLQLLPLVPGLNNIRQRTYMSELVNRSADQIAIAPAAVVQRYDGNTLDGATVVEGPTYLYPGERFPVQIDPSKADRITQTRIEWKPARRTALPGPRTPLEVQVSGTRAELGSVLLNFTQRFSYKSVRVQGTVKNPGSTIVRKPRLWVSLRDGEGRLTGFEKVDLPAIGPGDSAPFEARIQQQGKDFAKVETLYQAGD